MLNYNVKLKASAYKEAPQTMFDLMYVLTMVHLPKTKCPAGRSPLLLLTDVL